MSARKGSSDMRSADESATVEEKASLKHIERLTGIAGHQIESDVDNYAPRLRGKILSFCLAFVAGTGFTLFGYVVFAFELSLGLLLILLPYRYDQGVMSSLLTLEPFERTFPQVVIDDAHPNHATLQSFVVAVYELGCLAGALCNLWLGDKIGRRK